jgi:hypothetical protein
VFADTLLQLERTHLLRILAWGATSVLLGTLLLATLAATRRRSPLLANFGIQTAAWGAVDLALAGWAWRALALRDLAGATRLDRIVWLNIGLDAGYVFVGAALAIVGWRLARSHALVGAGVAIVVQGLALALLDLQFAEAIARFM